MAAAVCWNKKKINETADLKCSTIYHRGFGCRACRVEVIKLLRRRQLKDRSGLITCKCSINCQKTVRFYNIKSLLLLFAGINALFYFGIWHVYVLTLHHILLSVKNLVCGFSVIELIKGQ